MPTPKKLDFKGVPVLGPDGHYYDAPAAELVDYLRDGSKVVQPMLGPDGHRYFIPMDEVEAAIGEGSHLLRRDGSPYPEGEEPTIVGRNAAGQPIWGDAPKEKEGFLKSAADAVTGSVKGVGQLLDPRATPQEKAEGMTTPFDYALRPFERVAEGQVEEGRRAIEDVRAGEPLRAVGEGLAAITPGAGPWAAQTGERIGEQIGEGDVSGAAGTLAGNALVAAAPDALGRVPAIVRGSAEATKAMRDYVKGANARFQAPTKTINTPIAPGEMTPLERFRAAREMGVNLDRAQATNAWVPKAEKTVTERSVTGSGPYKDLQVANEAALHEHARGVLDATGAPAMSREEFGDSVREAMQTRRSALESKERTLYEGLDERLGEKAPDMAEVRKRAQGIYNANKRFYDNHPEALTGADARVWKWVKDLATDGKEGEQAKVDTWADLQRARSHLLDVTRGPEFVGDMATGWAKQLTGAIDETMTSAEHTPGLSDADRNDFRQANSLHKTLKETYDDPQSPFYWIARGDGLQAADRLNSLTPAQARQFRNEMSQINRNDLIQQHSRQTMSRLLDPAGNGTPDLRNFPSRWNRAQAEKVEGVLTPEQTKSLDDLAAVTKPVFENANPSGTSAILQPAAEVSGVVSGIATPLLAGHPLAAAGGALVGGTALAGARGLARAVTDPERTASIMEGPRPTALQSFQRARAAVQPALPNPTPGQLAVTGAAASQAQAQPQSAADRFRQAQERSVGSGSIEPRTGVSTPPKGGTISSIYNAEPNEVHDAAKAAAVEAASAPAPAAPGPVPQLATGAPPAGPAEVHTGISAEPQGAGPQSSVVAPEGATHEVLHPEEDRVIGHLVNGEYVPLNAGASE